MTKNETLHHQGQGPDHPFVWSSLDPQITPLLQNDPRVFPPFIWSVRFRFLPRGLLPMDSFPSQLKLNVYENTKVIKNDHVGNVVRSSSSLKHIDNLLEIGLFNFYYSLLSDTIPLRWFLEVLIWVGTKETKKKVSKPKVQRFHQNQKI